MIWKRLEQSGEAPSPRSSHTACALQSGEIIVVFGGENAPRTPVGNSTHVYRTDSNSWVTLFPLNKTPSDRLGHAAACVSGREMLLHGGRSQVSEASTMDDLYSFDLPSGVWRSLSTRGPAPEPRNYHAAAAADGVFYVFGGCGRSGRLADLWRYDVRGNGWQSFPSLQSMLGRGGAGLFVNGREAFVVGGFTGKESNDVFRFDFRNQGWESVETSGASFTARSVFGKALHGSSAAMDSKLCCPHAGHILVFGGEIDPSDLGHAGAGQFDDTCFCLDIERRQWDVFEVKSNDGDLPGPRGWAASCWVPNGLVLHGGINEDNVRLGDLYMLDVHS